jgi:predicted ATPase with chaperone activity
MASLRLPEHFDTLDLSHRRRQSLLRVARGLADLEGSARVTFRHFDRAADLVITPMVSLSQLFA